MSFEEQLKLLGDEFVEAMESEKNVIYPQVYDAITSAFGLQEEIADLHLNKDEPVLSFLRKFYELGYYAGIKFMLDPDDLHKETIMKVYGK